MPDTEPTPPNDSYQAATVIVIIIRRSSVGLRFRVYRTDQGRGSRRESFRRRSEYF